MAQASQPISQPMITEANQALAADTAWIVRLGTPPTMGKGGDVPLSESFMSSLHSLSANVTRTILTMLGIIIGVASVIALLAYGNGVVAKSLAALEANGSMVLRSLRRLAQAHTFLHVDGHSAVARSRTSGHTSLRLRAGMDAGCLPTAS